MNQAINNKSEVKTVSVKPESNKPDTVKPESVKLDSPDTFEIFTNHFTGNVNEVEFDKFFRICNFSTPESMADSFKEWNSKNKMLCARKSNQPFKLALWQTYQDMQSNSTKDNKKIDAISKPVINIKKFANDLNCEVKDLDEWVNMVKLQGFIDGADDKEILVITVEASKGIECDESDIDDFIAFVSESLKLKVK